MSLLDEHRQWFKAKVGLNASETPREFAFCAHAIQDHEDLFIVPDATKDSRFANNPLVTGDPDIRFYAGTTLETTDGHALGTLCVIDRVPRTLRDDQLTALRALGRQVISQLELRRSRATLARAQTRAREDATAARRSQAALAEFATGVCHDFAPPLHSLSEAVTSLRSGGPIDKTLGLVDGHVTTMRTLVNEMLQFVGSEYPPTSERPQPVPT